MSVNRSRESTVEALRREGTGEMIRREGTGEMISARRTECLDAPSILELATDRTNKQFGRTDVVHLIEKASVGVSLVNADELLLGHAAFFDYPNCKSLDSSKWESVIAEFYDLPGVNAINAMFMHYFVARPDYSLFSGAEIVKMIFNAVPDVHRIFLMLPKGVELEPALSELFRVVEPKSEEGLEGYDLHVCHRHDHAPVLHIRKARVQDHDDLTPIFNRQSAMLRDTYGGYFLAEMIEAQNDEMHCLAAEVEGKAIGFMSVSTDVNLDLLNECFELGPFHGFREPHEEDITERAKTPTPTPEPSPSPPSPEQAAEEEVGSKAGSVHGKDSPTSVKSAGSKKGESETAVRTKLSESHLTGSAQSLLEEEDDEQVIPMDSLDTFLDAAVPTPHAVSVLPTPRLPTLVKYPRRFVPEYHGEGKAICIQLFCIDERYETRSCDFLNKVFQLFPDKDFCVITVPHLVPEFPLLQQFVRVTPRCPSTLPQELYVFHRAGLYSDFHVREACSSDYESVEKLVGCIDRQDELLKDLKQFNHARRDEDGLPIRAYVAVCRDQVVGVTILRREEEIEYIRSHYNIEDFVYFNHHLRTEHGHISHFAINPIFNHMSKGLLKEAARLSKMTSLYYPIYPPYVDKKYLSHQSLATVLNQLVPVRPRRQIIYPVDRLGRNAPSDRVLQTPEPYALYHINRKLFAEPKVTINARIVVVGASDAGLGFLETLAFCPHLRFNNLTLISPHGLPSETDPDPRSEKLLSKSLCYDRDSLSRLSLRTWTNIVYGKMTAIDRHKRHVVVDGRTIVPYDHVVLATGLQYQVPCPTEADVSLNVTNSELPHSPDRRSLAPQARNLFVINDEFEAQSALAWLDQNFINKAGRALVYGSSLDAYSCVHTLLESGMTADRIVFVQPPIQGTPSINNPSVQDTLDSALREKGVEIHQGFYLAQWNDGEAAEEIYAASFTSHAKPVRIECAAVFAFYKKMVDEDAFQAINDACLVYDGKLVVDSYFHTNDPSIRGLGTLTKFQRKYHADQWSHSNFNSKEVGIQLAGTMLTLFDPTLEPEQQPPPEILKLIPLYRSPKIQYAVLPGGYYYLHIHKPDLNEPLDVQMTKPEYGRVLITGSPGGEVDYFRLHINQYNTVQTITCLARTEFPVENIRCVYGLHERCLNNLVSRFTESLVSDLYSFFAEPWALAVYHDRFPDFTEEIRELLTSRPEADLESMEERVRALIDDDLTITKKSRDQLETEYEKQGAKRAVETRLLSFLHYNYYHLPMYAKPGMVQ